MSLLFYSFVLGKQNTVLEWTILLDVVAHSFLRYIFFLADKQIDYLQAIYCAIQKALE